MCILIIILFPTVIMATQNENITKVTIRTESLGRDRSTSQKIMLINMTINNLGHLIYIEEFYTIDSYSQPNLYDIKRFDQGNITENNLSFQILRPRKSSEMPYRLIKAIVVLNKTRVYERWLSDDAKFYVAADQLKVFASDKNVPENLTESINETGNTESVENVNNTNTINETKYIKPIIEIDSTPRKSPGFGLITAIAIISAMYISLKYISLRDIGKNKKE